MKNFLSRISDLGSSYFLIAWTLVFALIFTVLLLTNQRELLLGITGVAILGLFLNHFSTLTLLLIGLVPLSINVSLVSGFQLSMPSEGLLIIFTGLMSLKLLSEKQISLPIKHPISILLLLDLGWSLVTTLSSEMPMVSFKRLVLKGLFISCYFFIIPAILEKGSKYKSVFMLYGIGIIIPILHATYKHSMFGLSQKASIQTSFPFYDEHTVYGACIAFIFPFFVIWFLKAKKYRAELFGLLLVLIIGVVLSYSRAAWLSLFISFVVFILIKLNVTFKSVTVLAGLTIGLLAFNFSSIYQKLENTNTKYGDEMATHLVSVTNLKNDASNLERINRWVSSIKLFQDRPFTGYGPGTYQFVYDRFQSSQYMTRISTNIGDRGNAHSEYLTLLSESGLIGLLLFLSIIGTSYYYTMQSIQLNVSSNVAYILMASILGLTTFYIHGLFNSFIDSNKMAILVYSSLGIITSISQKYVNPKSF